jgi:hypothetical protein
MLHCETSREPPPFIIPWSRCKIPGLCIEQRNVEKKTNRPLKIDAAAMPLHWSVCWCSDSKAAVPLSSHPDIPDIGSSVRMAGLVTTTISAIRTPPHTVRVYTFESRRLPQLLQNLGHARQGHGSSRQSDIQSHCAASKEIADRSAVLCYCV